MAKAALTKECPNHFTFKEVTENINRFCKLKGYDIYVKTEESKGDYIPDICFYEVGTNKLLGVLEVVNYNRLSHKKVNSYKNLNQFLWYVDILPWTLRYLGIDFALWESDFSIYFKKVLEGTENEDFVRVASEANAMRKAFFDGVQATLVRYDVIDANEYYGIYDVICYEESGKSYHVIFTGSAGEKFMQLQKRDIKNYRISDEPIYKVFSEYPCWIDSLEVPKHLTQII